MGFKSFTVHFWYPWRKGAKSEKELVTCNTVLFGVYFWSHNFLKSLEEVTTYILDSLECSILVWFLIFYFDAVCLNFISCLLFGKVYLFYVSKNGAGNSIFNLTFVKPHTIGTEFVTCNLHDLNLSYFLDLN